MDRVFTTGYRIGQLGEYAQLQENLKLRHPLDPCITTTFLQRPLIWITFSILKPLSKTPVINGHQSTTAINLRSRRWSLYKGLTANGPLEDPKI